MARSKMEESKARSKMEGSPIEDDKVIYVNGFVYLNFKIENLQDQSKNIGAHVGTKTKNIGFNEVATNIGPGAGGINNNHGPGAGGLNSGPAAGSINAGSIDTVNMTIVSIVAKPGPAQPLTKEQIRKHFGMCDKDGNGFLTKQEIKEAFDRLCALFPAYRTRKAIALADENGDGRVNMKDQEFEALIDYVYDLGYTKVKTTRNNSRV